MIEANLKTKDTKMNSTQVVTNAIKSLVDYDSSHDMQIKWALANALIPTSIPNENKPISRWYASMDRQLQELGSKNDKELAFIVKSKSYFTKEVGTRIYFGKPTKENKQWRCSPIVKDVGVDLLTKSLIVWVARQDYTSVHGVFYVNPTGATAIATGQISHLTVVRVDGKSIYVHPLLPSIARLITKHSYGSIYDIEDVYRLLLDWNDSDVNKIVKDVEC